MNDCLYIRGDIPSEAEMQAVLAACAKGFQVDLYACRHQMWTVSANWSKPECAACEADYLAATWRERPTMRLVACVRVSVPVPPRAGGR